MKRNIIIIVILSMILVFMVFFVDCDSDDSANSSDNLNVFVSILPQKFFVEKIGGDNIKVSVMVKPGSSPATYEPKPMQMKQLSKSDIYINIGVPFEKSWMSKIKSANKNMLIVDGDKDIEKRRMIKEHTHKEVEEETEEIHNDKEESELSDPHIWLSPTLVKKHCEHILNAFVEVDPANSDIYRNNFNKLTEEIDKLDKEIKNLLKDKEIKEFMVFHPSWGYFAKDYGLRQVPIEIEGKEPSPKELKEFIDLAKEKDIKIIFVQPQFSKKSAKAIADAINGEILVINPLAENWLENMKEVAETFKEVLR
ncbi:MAG: metal ABC transporter solute-binding protein, Zn/Mn family [Spirochaetota bacterium]